jgi:hypothetical protein
VAQLDALAGQRARLKSASLWDRPFYFWMSLPITAVVVYGFSFTVNANLFHPPSPRPAILYVHAVLFTGWLVFLLVQSALVRTRNVKVHRKLGWFGLAVGASMPFVGVATAIAINRMHLRAGDSHHHVHQPAQPASVDAHRPRDFGLVVMREERKPWTHPSKPGVGHPPHNISLFMR